MTEHEFKKRLKEKDTNTYLLVSQLLNEENGMVPKTRTNFIKRIFHTHKKDAFGIVKNNFFKILESTPKENISNLLETLLMYSQLHGIISTNIIKVLEYLNRDLNENSIQAFLQEFVKEVSMGNRIVKRHFREIVDQIDPSKLFASTETLGGISDNGDDILNNKLEQNMDAVAESMLMQIRNVYANNFADREEQSFREDCKQNSQFVLIILQELLESENQRPVDVKKIGEGAYSKVYKIGEKVLKIGMPRKTYKIPNHRRILQPELRTELKTRTGEKFACVEVADYVETPPKNINREQLYKLYKELREDGIVCADLRYDNVGRLQKKNKPNLYGEELYVEPGSAGLLGKPKDVLDAGELVVIDSDFIYMGQTSRTLDMTLMSELFETQYLEEKRVEQEIISILSQEEDYIQPNISRSTEDMPNKGDTTEPER